MTKIITTALGLFAVATLYGAESREQAYHYYPECTPIINEIDRAWHEGQITEATAHTLIRNCLAWEDRRR